MLRKYCKIFLFVKYIQRPMPFHNSTFGLEIKIKKMWKSSIAKCEARNWKGRETGRAENHPWEEWGVIIMQWETVILTTKNKQQPILLDALCTHCYLALPLCLFLSPMNLLCRGSFLITKNCVPPGIHTVRIISEAISLLIIICFHFTTLGSLVSNLPFLFRCEKKQGCSPNL